MCVYVCTCVHMSIYACDRCGRLGSSRDMCGTLVGSRCDTCCRLGDGADAFQWNMISFEELICVYMCVYVCICEYEYIFEGFALIFSDTYRILWIFMNCRGGLDTIYQMPAVQIQVCFNWFDICVYVCMCVMCVHACDTCGRLVGLRWDTCGRLGLGRTLFHSIV